MIVEINKNFGVEIDMEDVENIIGSMDSDELAQVAKMIGHNPSPEIPSGGSVHIEGSLDARMKDEWWDCAKRRYTLEDLESKLGSKPELDQGDSKR